MPDRSVSESMPAWRFLAVVTALAALILPADAVAQGGTAPSEVPVGEGGGHFAAPDPADLTAEEASALYAGIRDQMIAGYRLSGIGATRNFIAGSDSTPHPIDPRPMASATSTTMPTPQRNATGGMREPA